MSEGSARILVVDDEPQIRRFLRAALSPHGYHIEEAECGADALKQVPIVHPDLVILDLGLPDMDGKQVIERLREWSQTPILVLSVREREEEKVAALDAGADDYITKPFSIGELLARMRVAIRHTAHTEDSPVISVGELSVDLGQRVVTMQGKRLKLTPTEYEIVKVLVRHQGRVVTHRRLLTEVWGPQVQGEIQCLRVYIRQLRRKIEPEPNKQRYIITEPGVGYRLVAPGQ